MDLPHEPARLNGLPLFDWARNQTTVAPITAPASSTRPTPARLYVQARTGCSFALAGVLAALAGMEPEAFDE